MDNFKTVAEWSLAVRARDGRCMRCGGTVALVAHHIKPKSIHPELRLVLDNGETLCSNCHTEHHKKHHGAQSAEKRAVRKARVAMLVAENSALKAELAAIRAERRADLAGRNEMSQLRASLKEYEQAYDLLTAWEPA